MDHEVIVGDAREIASLRRTNKNDRRDAERLARYGRIDPALLAPIAHPSEELQLDLAVISAGTTCISAGDDDQHCRRSDEKFGLPPPADCADVFANRCPEVLGERLLSIVQPLLEQIVVLTQKIKVSDGSVEEMAEQRDPETG